MERDFLKTRFRLLWLTWGLILSWEFVGCKVIEAIGSRIKQLEKRATAWSIKTTSAFLWSKVNFPDTTQAILSYKENYFYILKGSQRIKVFFHPVTYQPWNLPDWPSKTTSFLRQTKSNFNNRVLIATA